MLLQSVAHGSRSLGFRYARGWFPVIILSIVTIWVHVGTALWVVLVFACICFGFADTAAINRRVLSKL